MVEALEILRRILANAFILLSLFFFPWWVGVIFSLCALFLFKNFYELFIWAFIADLLYGVPVAAFYDFKFFLTFGALLAYGAVEWIKTQIRFYE